MAWLTICILICESSNVSSWNFSRQFNEVIVSAAALRSFYTAFFKWLKMLCHCLYFRGGGTILVLTRRRKESPGRNLMIKGHIVLIKDNSVLLKKTFRTGLFSILWYFPVLFLVIFLSTIWWISRYFLAANRQISRFLTQFAPWWVFRSVLATLRIFFSVCVCVLARWFLIFFFSHEQLINYTIFFYDQMGIFFSPNWQT